MRVAWLLLVALGLTSCGYVGDPQPPALKIPLPIADLQASQVGAKIKLRFTIPDLTTERLPVTQVTVELRGNDLLIPVSAQVPGPVEAEAPLAAAWLGREVTFRVRLQNTKGRDSQWSNLVTRNVTPAVPTPTAFTAKPAENGIALAWSGPATSWSILRDEAPLADVTKPAYLDTAAEVGKSYRYQIQAKNKAEAVSELTPELAVTNVDTFPPAAPKGLNVIASTNAVELSWDRNTEADLKHYRVWRDGTVLADAIPLPTYTDRTAQPGKTHRYTLSAVDTRGNESPQSQPVEITPP